MPVTALSARSGSSAPPGARAPAGPERQTCVNGKLTIVAAMKAQLLQSVCFTFPYILLPLVQAVHASPSPADRLLFCGVGHEQWQQPHPRPAAKRAANLNVGEPRTVRMIYFLPNNRPFRQEVVDSMKTVIRKVQTFYAGQMDAHGYGNKTIRYETDARGEPLVHLVDGIHPESHYYNTFGGSMIDELWQVFDFSVNIYSVIIDTQHGGLQGRGGGGRRYGKTGGYAWLTSGYIGGDAHGSYAGVTSHELGHAFGLQHDFRNDTYTMSYGKGGRLSACAAEFLAVHPYFDPDIPDDEGDASDYRTPFTDTISCQLKERHGSDQGRRRGRGSPGDPLCFIESRRRN